MLSLFDESMVPRRRPFRPKVGLLRMDAALDFFAEMGFGKQLVRKTINNLLKTYGGDEGWPFIEEGCYKVVLDDLLEEKVDHSEVATVNDALDDKDNEKAVAVADDDAMDGYAALEDGVMEQANSYLEAMNTVPQIGDSNMNDIEDEPKRLCGVENAVGANKNDDYSTGGALIVKKPCADQDADLTNTEPASQVLNTRKRKPCYGWLSDDDDDYDDDEDERVQRKTKQLAMLVFPSS